MKIEDFNNKMKNYKIQLEKGENIDKELFKKDVYDMMNEIQNQFDECSKKLKMLGRKLEELKS